MQDGGSRRGYGSREAAIGGMPETRQEGGKGKQGRGEGRRGREEKSRPREPDDLSQWFFDNDG